jgi:hypothetical protein
MVFNPSRIQGSQRRRITDRDPQHWFAVIDNLIICFRPTLDELGILTPEEMGYDKPELALPSPYDIH